MTVALARGVRQWSMGSDIDARFKVLHFIILDQLSQRAYHSGGLFQSCPDGRANVFFLTDTAGCSTVAHCVIELNGMRCNFLSK